MLAAQLPELRLPPQAEVIDLGTGSGVLAIAAARAHPGARVVAVDLSRRALLCARLNARLNGVKVEVRRGDLFGPVPARRFDLIVSNPPYVPGPLNELPSRGLARAWEGGPDGRAVLDRICAGVGDHLQPGGVVLLVHNAMCDEHATVNALTAAGLRTEVVFRHRGKLGPILRARAQWLEREGLLSGEADEVVVVRAERAVQPAAAGAEEVCQPDARA